MALAQLLSACADARDAPQRVAGSAPIGYRLPGGTDLETEFKVLSSRLWFGLNFERHRPEIVELSQRPIRKRDKLRVLPKRGSIKGGGQRLSQVKAIRKVGEGKVADLVVLETPQPESQSMTLDDLVAVAVFRDTIYPGLTKHWQGTARRRQAFPYRHQW